MQRIDRWVGLALALLGLAVLWSARAFPNVPGQKLGAGFLPMLVGAGLLLCALALVVRSLRGGAYAEDEAPRRGSEHFGSSLVIIGAVVALHPAGRAPRLPDRRAAVPDGRLPALRVSWRTPLLWAHRRHAGRARRVLQAAARAAALGRVAPASTELARHGRRLTAFGLVFQPYVLLVILLSALYGLFVGAIPGLTATMATALLVPVTFFMPPVPAVAAIVTATAMAIFSGDIPSALLRMPGTPASAAYTDEAFLLTKKGQAELALGAGLVFSVLGGIFGVLVLIVAAPALAEVALKFSSFEYFWLVMLGFTCAIFIAGSDPLKGVVVAAARPADRRASAWTTRPARRATPSATPS